MEIEPVGSALSPGSINERAKHGEEPGGAMDLIEDHEPMEILREIELGLGKTREVGRRLQIEIECVARARNLHREGGLAHLSRPKECHGR